MSRTTRSAVVFLVVLTLFLAAANLLFTSTLVHRANANANAAAAAKASIAQLCQSGNEARQQ